MQYQQLDSQTTSKAAEGCRVLSLGLDGKDLEALSALLKSRRCHLAHTKDGLTGVEMLHQAALSGNSFQIVLLDAAGLKLDVSFLINKIKDDPFLKGINLAVLSSESYPTEGLAKPLDPVQVHDLLDCVPQEKRQTGPLSESKLRVLVVEDHPMNQRVIQIMLSKMGCQVDIASDGKEGLNYLANVPYDLVLMDIKLPKMDGLSVVRALRSRQTGELNRDVPIIGVTALASREDRICCLDAGMNDYLSKPFRSADLAAILKKWSSIEAPSAS